MTARRTTFGVVGVAVLVLAFVDGQRAESRPPPQPPDTAEAVPLFGAIVGEVRMFAGPMAAVPSGWLVCD